MDENKILSVAANLMSIANNLEEEGTLDPRNTAASMIKEQVALLVETVSEDDSNLEQRTYLSEEPILSPEELFESYDSNSQNKYFIERRNLIPHDVLNKVANMFNHTAWDYKDLNDFDESVHLEMFLKIDALAFCCESLKDEANRYKRYRENKKGVNGKYIRQKKTKETTLKKSAEGHLGNAIQTLDELTGNQQNIEILKKININKPPRQQEYFNEMHETTLSILKEAGFKQKDKENDNELEVILPILKKLYKTK